MRTIFSLGQVAEICKVTPRTVKNWLRANRLDWQTFPGTSFKRIFLKSLVQFLTSKRETLEEEEYRARILFIGFPDNVKLLIRQKFLATDYQVFFAADVTQTEISMRTYPSDCVVINFSPPDDAFDDASELARGIRKNELNEPVLILGCANSTYETDEDESPFNEIFRQSDGFAEHIQSLVKVHVLWE